MKITQLSDAFFKRLETMSLNLRSRLDGYFGGKHLVKTYGQTVEFADFREYRLGDDIRRIDWNLYSRFEKYFLRLYTDERQMQVQVFLDMSASMGRVAPGKGEYAVSAAAALGFLAVQNMDRLSMYLMREKSAEDPFGKIVGKNAFFRAISSLEECEFDGDTDLYAAITGCPDTGVNNGLTVIISDFMTDSDWKKAVDYLLYKKRQILLMQVMTPDELDPAYEGRVHLLDAESLDAADPRNMKLRINRNMQRAYAAALRDFLGDIRSFAAKRDVGYLMLNTGESIERALFGELLQGGVMS